MLPSQHLRARDKRRLALPDNGTAIERIATRQSSLSVSGSLGVFPSQKPQRCVRCHEFASRAALRNVGVKGAEAYLHRKACSPA